MLQGAMHPQDAMRPMDALVSDPHGIRQGSADAGIRDLGSLPAGINRAVASRFSSSTKRQPLDHFYLILQMILLDKLVHYPYQISYLRL